MVNSHSIALKANQLLSKMDCEIRNISLLTEALTHPSLKEKENSRNYERLEFLGDAVLSLIIAEILFKNYPEEDEGLLSQRRVSLISGSKIAEIGLKAGIDEFVMIAEGEEKRGERKSKSCVENLMEALLGAIYVNRGISAAKRFVRYFWDKEIKNSVHPKSNPKNELQEFSQKSSMGLPVYEIIGAEGEVHNPVFTAKVSIGNNSAEGSGKTKKQAEIEAAKKLLDILKPSH